MAQRETHADSSADGRLAVEALDRYLTGEASVAERDAVGVWLTARPGVLDAPPRRDWDTDAAWAAVDLTGHTLHSANRSKRRGNFAWRSAAVASAMLAFLGVMFGWQLPRRHTTPAARTYRTAAAQRAVVQLSDGSRVTLAPRSVLRLTDFGEGHRTLTLEGEAYFEVRERRDAPFLVHTGSVTTRVLGTAFDLLFDPKDGNVRVAVTAGKIAVAHARASRPVATLTAGMVAFATDSITTTAMASRVSDYTTWMNGHLVFEGATVAEMLAAVGRWYGYEFRLVDSTLARRHVSADLDGTSRTGTLQALQQMLGVRMSFDGNVITLHPRRASALPASRVPRILDDTLTPHLEVGR